MSDLSPLTQQALGSLVDEINNLETGGTKAEPKLHKFVMLLSVLELMERGEIVDNRIYYDEELRRVFGTYFRLVCRPNDWCQPAMPFFHLRTSSFWRHKVIEGREQQYADLTTSGGGNKRIRENIEYAYLSDFAFHVFIDTQARQLLRTHLESILNPSSENANFAYHGENDGAGK